MTAIERVPSRDLTAMAAEIRHHVEQVETGLQSAVANAVRAGELLTAVKSRVGHGGWMGWLAEHFPASERTARAYMHLAANRQRVADFEPTSIRAALKQLAAPEMTEPEAVLPDRCPRCDRVVRGDRPHQCRETHRRLVEARDALKHVLADLRRCPPESTPPESTPRAAADSEMAATVVHLASEVQRALGGEPERDERQQRLARVQRTIEGQGFPICNCGARLTLVCPVCSPPEAVE